MPHGNSSQDTQPSKTSSGNDGDQQRTQKSTPQSPAPSFTPATSSAGPQSPSYQIQQLIMSRNPVAGQNVNITLQNVGSVVAGNQQITLTSLPISNPSSPGFQFSSQPRRFEHGSPSYIQVTSPMSQQVQTQSPTHPNAVPLQALQGVRGGTTGASLGMCSQSPTRGLMEASLLVRQLSLAPSSTGHLFFQEGPGITQIAQGTPVHLPSGTPAQVPTRTLLHSNSQTVGSVHKSGTTHLATTNLSPQISSIIQGQLIQQQQQVLHGQQLARTISFDRTSGGMIAGVATASTFGIKSQPIPTSPSRATGSQGLSSLPLAPTVSTALKKQTIKLEEIPPATQKDAQMRKQCLEHHHKAMKLMKENFKEYLVELFFLQHCQGNMMDFLTFKKKPTILLQTFLRQNDLDLEIEEDEGDKFFPQVTQFQEPPPSPMSEIPINMDMQTSSMQRETPTDSKVTQVHDSSDTGSLQPKLTLGIPQIPQAAGRIGKDGPFSVGMSHSQPTSAAPTKISLSSPSRAQATRMPATSISTVGHPASHTEAQSQMKGKISSSIPTVQSTQNQISHQPQTMLHDQPSLKPPSLQASASKLGSDAGKLTVSASLHLAPSSPTTPTSFSDSIPPPASVSPKRLLSPGASKALSPSVSRSPGSVGSQPQDLVTPFAGDSQPDASLPKPSEQENQIHQRISELRKEGLWSLRRLPKLQEPCRPKSHWDYLLEEMQWMAADFAQERMWKIASAKKLVRTAARYCQEKQQKDARAKKEDEDRLRRIAWLAAREIQFFWSNIEQVVEIKLQVEQQQKRKKIFCVPGSKRGENGKSKKLETLNQSLHPTSLHTKMKAEASKAEKHGFGSRGESNLDGAQKQMVLIDSLLNTEGGSSAHVGARKHSRDIAEVAAAAELLLPRGSSRISCNVKSSPPPLLHGRLREYQQITVDWLAKQYKKNLNGILADESGLGKSIQVIGLMAHLASNEGVWGPHLIVVRSCKVLKWELEFKRWCPALKLLLYFGSQRELRRKRQKWEEPNSFNICITSYKQLFKGHQAFMKIRWKYLVMDEVHQIQNMTEKHWDAIFNLPSQRRLLLRDTPLPHTWKELWTMVHFLIPGLSRAYLDFPVKENRDQDQDYKHTISIRLHRSTQPFILRRSKRDVDRQLPKKSEHVLKCQLSNRQRTLYEDVMMQPGAQDALKGGHFLSVLHVLMQLQKICNHPELVDPRPEHSSYVPETLQYKTASLALKALEYDPWKSPDLSIFDLLRVENKMTRYEAQVIPKQKVSRKLIQEICSSPDLAPRPTRAKIKPNSLFEPVLFGQKPEGKIFNFQSSTASATTTTAAHQGQVRRAQITTPAAPQGTKVPTTSHVQAGGPRPQTPGTLTTASQMRQVNQPHSQAPSAPVQQNLVSQRLVLSSQARLPSGEVVKIAQLTASGGAQGRIAQPETPVTLQFQGNKFTLSQSQLRQLTAGQPLQLQGNVLQIVSAPGQYLRPQGSVVLPTMAQGTATNAIRPQQQLGATNPAAVALSAPIVGKSSPAPTATSDQLPKSALGVTTPAQESTEDKQRVIKERLDLLFTCNERRCAQAPLYGSDLLSLFSLNPAASPHFMHKSYWGYSGYVNCLMSSRCPEDSLDLLRPLILSSEQQKTVLESHAKRLLCVVPTVVAASPVIAVPHPPPSYTNNIKIMSHSLREKAAPYIKDLRERTSPYCVQFPDLRLIQCDSGKLEALVILLRKLRSEGRRVLIFSQMLHMLDILEIFLDLHSLTFLRIDENANHEQCQELTKSFNRDTRIFCMVLSTHVYALSIPHVEADTVIFYDSDLNPVVDGKTQSWCDLIGRSKDIHVYRLVTANSIEEKLLRNGTKDLIREVAAQGSDYTLAFLTQQTIKELFEVCSPLEDSGFRVKAEEFVLLSQEPSPCDTITAKVARPFVEALGRIEHGADESIADTENVPINNAGICPSENGDQKDNKEPSQLQELVELMQQLTPIEKYALHYLELSHICNGDLHLGCIEEKLKAAKQEWDSQLLRVLKEREESMQWESEESEKLLTYTREDAYNMDFMYNGPDGQTDIMPVWTPPTPPQDENDIYIDSVMCLMYDTTPITETKLPPVYVRKERKRHRTDPAAAGRKKIMRHGESVVPPRSLFDRAAPNPLKVRKEGKEQKKNILLKQQTQFAKPLPTLIKPVMETGPDNPEWLISEDWALLQAVKQLLELPLNLTVVSPAHTPNWDLVSDVVNSCSRIYRSSKQCRSRYENVIIPREEGKLLSDISPKKKSENIFKNKPLRTNQIYAQDEGMSHSQLFNTRFDLMKTAAGKRSPPIKPLLGMNPFQKNPKHASVLAESGINYDKPMLPVQIATLRADRIAKEKKALVDQVRAQQQSTPSPQQNGQQPSPTTPVQPAQALTTAPVVVQPQVVVQPHAAAKGPSPVTTSIANPTLLTGTLKAAIPGTTIAAGTVSGNVIVNTVSGITPATFQPINKRLVTPVVSGTVSTATTAQMVQQRTVATTPNVPTEMVTIAASQGVRAMTPATGATVVSTNLTTVQTQARAIVTQVTTATTAGVQLAGKITPAQFQLLRQQGQVTVPQIQAQAQSPGQIKTVAKISSEQLMKLQKQKLQLSQQVAQAGTLTGTTAQVQVQPQQAQQLATVTASRAGAVLTGTTMTNLQVARLLQAQGQMQAQPGQTAQVALAKPPVVSAVVSTGGVTTLPVTVAGISVSINQPQKVAGGQTIMAQPLHVQPLIKLKQHPTTQQQQQQKALQSQNTLGQQKPYLSLQITTPQVSTASQQQKVTYTSQPGIKTQFLTTSLTQKAAGTQQVQAQIQVAKLPQVVQQQAALATLQQVVSASQQVQPQTVTLTQATATGQQQVQVIPAGSAAAHVVQQKLLQQQVLAAAAAAASPQIQVPVTQSTAEVQNQQGKLQVRTPTVRIKAPTKPS